MKAKELAELLLQYPDFEVQACFADVSNCSYEKLYPEYYTLSVDGIDDIGHSDKVIVLDVNY